METESPHSKGGTITFIALVDQTIKKFESSLVVASQKWREYEKRKALSLFKSNDLHVLVLSKKSVFPLRFRGVPLPILSRKSLLVFTLSIVFLLLIYSN